MPQINCHIPVRVRITGRPSDAQLDQLVETIARAVAARIRLAERSIGGETGPAGHAPRAVAGGLVRLASTTDAPAGPAPTPPAERRPQVRVNLRTLRKLKRPSVRINLRGPRTRKPRVVTPRAMRVFEEIAGQVDEYAVLRKKLYGLGHLFEVDHLIEKRFISVFSAHGGTEHPDTWPSMAVPKNRQVAAQIPGYTGYIHLEKTRRMEALIPHQLEELFTPQQVWDAHARVLQELGLGDELTRVRGLFEQLDLDPPVEFRRTAPPGTFDNWPRYELVTPPTPTPTPTAAPARPAAATPPPPPGGDAAGGRVGEVAPPPTPPTEVKRTPSVLALPLTPGDDDEVKRLKPPAQAAAPSPRAAVKTPAPLSANDRAAVGAVAREMASESAATLKGELRLLRATGLVQFASTALEAFAAVSDVAEFYSMATGGLAGRGFILTEEVAAARALEAFAARLAGDYEPVNRSLAGMHGNLFKAGMDTRAAADAADELWRVYTTLGGVERDLDERVPRVETALGEVRAKLELATRIINSPSARTAAVLAELNTGNLARIVAAREDLYVIRAALDKSLRLFGALRDLLGADRDFLRAWYMTLVSARD